MSVGMLTSRTIVRLVICISVLSLLFLPELVQPELDHAYRYLRHAPLFTASYFETLWTVTVYAVLEPSYTVQFVRNPSRRLDAPRPDARRPSMRRPSKRLGEMARYVAPLLGMDLVLMKKYAGVAARDNLVVGGWDPDADAHVAGYSTSFLRPRFHHFTWSSPLQLRRALPPDPPSSRRLVVELVVALVIYDALFFLAHLALHRIPGLARFHAPHHRHGEMHPQITNQLDVVERLILVLLANFSLNIIGAHVVTRALFVPLFVWLLVEIHSGLDLDLGYDKLLPAGWGAGAKRHAVHHRGGREFFEPYFCWWDDLLVMVCGGSARDGPAKDDDGGQATT